MKFSTLFFLLFSYWGLIAQSSGPPKDLEIMIRAVEFGSIAHVAYGENGTYLASSNQGDIIFSDVGTGHVIRQIKTDMLTFKDLTISANGDFMASISFYSAAADAVTHRGTLSLKPLSGKNEENKFIRLWDMSSGTYRWLKGHEKEVKLIKFDRKGKLLASAGKKDIIIWDIQSGQLKKRVAGGGDAHKKTISALAFSPDGRYLASAGADKVIKIWEIESGALFKTLSGHSARAISLRFSADGMQLLSGGEDKKLILWDWTTKSKQVFSGHKKNIVKAGFRPSEQGLVSIAEDGTLRLWDIQTGQNEIIPLPARPKQEKDIAVDFSPSGQYVAFTYYDEIGRSGWVEKGGKEIYIMDLEQRKIVRKIPSEENAPVTALKLSPDRKWLVAYSEDKTMRLFNLETLTQAQSYSIGDTAVQRLEITPDLSRIIYFYSDRLELCPFLNQDQSPQMQSYKQRKILSALSNEDIDIRSASLSHDGRYLAGVLDKKLLKIWSINQDGQLTISREIGIENKKRKMYIGKHKSPSVCAFSPDNKILAVGTRLPITFIELETGAITQKWYLEEDALEIKDISFINHEVVSVSYTHIQGGEKSAEYHLGHGRESMLVEADDFSEGINLLKGALKANRESSGGIPIEESMYPYRSAVMDQSVIEGIPRSDYYIFINADTPHELFVRPTSHFIWTYKEQQEVKDALANGTLSDYRKQQLNNSDRNLQGLEEHIDFDWDSSFDFGLKIDNETSISSYLILPELELFIFGGRDGSIRFRDITTGDQKLMLLIKEDAYVFITEDYFYRSSSNGYNLLNTRAGKDIYPFELMDLTYNRPDKVLETICSGLGLLERSTEVDRLITTFEKAYEKRRKKVEAVGEALYLTAQTQIPRVSILGQIPIETKASELDLKTRASDHSQAITSVHVYVNDVPVYGKQGLTVGEKKTKELDYEVTVPLNYGSNLVQVSVKNAAGLESFKESLSNITRTGKPEKVKLHLVAIGVSAYQNEALNLGYAAKDAQDLVKLFQTEGHHFDEVIVHELLDENVTVEHIRALKTPLLDSKPDDAVIVFFAGHGLFDEDLNYFLGGHDMDFSNPGLRGIKVEDLEQLVDGIPALNKLLLLDACHSGEVDEDEIGLITEQLKEDDNLVYRSVGTGFQISETKQIGLANSVLLVEEFFADIRRSSGATIISAASGLELAAESKELQNGVFTAALKEGLTTRAADLDEDGAVTVKELKQFLVDRVRQLSGNAQRPTARIENLRNDWRIW